MKKAKRVWALIDDRGEQHGAWPRLHQARAWLPITTGKPWRIVSATLTWTEPKPKRGKRA